MAFRVESVVGELDFPQEAGEGQGKGSTQCQRVAGTAELVWSRADVFADPSKDG